MLKARDAMIGSSSQLLDGAIPGHEDQPPRRLSLGSERRLRNRASRSSCRSLECSIWQEVSTDSEPLLQVRSHDSLCGTLLTRQGPGGSTYPGNNAAKKRSVSQGASEAAVPSFRDAVVQTFRQISYLVKREPPQPAMEANEPHMGGSPVFERRLLGRETADEHSSSGDSPSQRPQQGANTPPRGPTLVPTTKVIEGSSLEAMPPATARISPSALITREEMIEGHSTDPKSVQLEIDSTEVVRCGMKNTDPEVERSTSPAMKTTSSQETDVELSKGWWPPRRRSDGVFLTVRHNKPGVLQPEPEILTVRAGASHPLGGSTSIDGGSLPQRAQCVDDDRRSSLPVPATPRGTGGPPLLHEFAVVLEELQYHARRAPRRPSEAKSSRSPLSRPSKPPKKVDWSLIKVVRVEGGWLTIEENCPGSLPQILTETTTQFEGDSPDLSCLGVLPGSYRARDPFVTFVPQGPDSKVTKRKQNEIMAYVKRHRVPQEQPGVSLTGEQMSDLVEAVTDNETVTETDSHGYPQQTTALSAYDSTASNPDSPVGDEGDELILRRNTSGTVHIKHVARVVRQDGPS